MQGNRSDNKNPLIVALGDVFGPLIKLSSQLPAPLAYGAAIVITIVVGGLLIALFGAVVPSPVILLLGIIIIACLGVFAFIDWDTRRQGRENRETLPSLVDKDDETDNFYKFFGITASDDNTAVILPLFPIEKLKKELENRVKEIPNESLDQMDMLTKELKEMMKTTSGDNIISKQEELLGELRHSLEELKPKIEYILNTDLGEYDESDWQPTTKIIGQLHQRAFAQVDLEAYEDIAHIFSDMHCKPPKILFDDDVLGQLINGADENKKYKVLIAVGLFSNACTMNVAKLSREPQLRFRFLRKTESSEQNNQNTIKFEGESKSYSEQTDSALIARVKISTNQYLVIVGGIMAEGTQKIGEYMRYHWRDIYKDHLLEAKDEFAILFSVPLGSSKGRIQIERVWYSN